MKFSELVRLLERNGFEIVKEKGSIRYYGKPGVDRLIRIDYHSLCGTRFHFKGQTVYIDHVPAWVCAKCGEQYFDAPVYKRLEEIARHSHRIAKTICFPLAEYDMVLV